MRNLAALLLTGFVLMGCAPAPPPPSLSTAAPPPTHVALQPSAAPPAASPSPEPSPTLSPSPTPLPSPTLTPGPIVCSPLEGIELSELSSPDLLKTHFERPRPGSDEGHHGVDFAYWSRGDRQTMRGHPVQAVLAGRVAAVLPDRRPYGNAVIIESPLESLPSGWLQTLPALSASPVPTVEAPSLYCPPSGLKAGDNALYLLYAHFDRPSPLQVGQAVSCGETVGEVGTTGASVNDHLHLEARAGPAGVTFASMGHYNAGYAPAELSAYCAWRVSGLFSLIDPLDLLSLQP